MLVKAYGGGRTVEEVVWSEEDWGGGYCYGRWEGFGKYRSETESQARNTLLKNLPTV